MDIKDIASGTGQGFSIYAIIVDNHCLVEEFIDNLDVQYQKHISHLFPISFGTLNDSTSTNKSKIYSDNLFFRIPK